MPRLPLILLALEVFFYPNFLSAQVSSSKPVDVAYVQEFGEGIHPLLETYDVDPTTGELTLKGQMETPDAYVGIVPSPGDHFLYLLGQDLVGQKQHVGLFHGLGGRSPIPSDSDSRGKESHRISDQPQRQVRIRIRVGSETTHR